MKVTTLAIEQEKQLKEIGLLLLANFDMVAVKSTFCESGVNITAKSFDKLGLITSSNIINRKIVILYDLPCMMRRLLFNSLAAKKLVKAHSRTLFYIMLNYYYLISDAYYANAKHALMFEDDLVINKNLPLVLQMLNNMPKDYSFINFQPSPYPFNAAIQQFKERVSVYNTEGKLFINTSNMPTLSTGCIAMSRDYMKACIKICEEVITAKRKAEHIDVLLNSPYSMPDNIKPGMYVSTLPMFMQLTHAHLQSPLCAMNRCLEAFDASNDDFLEFD